MSGRRDERIVTSREQTTREDALSAHAFGFVGIDGAPLPLARFAGHPILIVNTASECGYTPQYAGLQLLWQSYRDQGLVVLGVPSNDFGGQEPGDESAIETFCTRRFGVDFPLTAKQRVIGGDAHPFYRWVVETLGEGAAPRWNFHKYLVDGGGSLVELWPAAVAPLDPPIVTAIETVLREP
jgi:glutathione peroxidase